LLGSVTDGLDEGMHEGEAQAPHAPAQGKAEATGLAHRMMMAHVLDIKAGMAHHEALATKVEHGQATMLAEQEQVLKRFAQQIAEQIAEQLSRFQPRAGETEQPSAQPRVASQSVSCRGSEPRSERSRSKRTSVTVKRSGSKTRSANATQANGHAASAAEAGHPEGGALEPRLSAASYLPSSFL